MVLGPPRVTDAKLKPHQGVVVLTFSVPPLFSPVGGLTFYPTDITGKTERPTGMNAHLWEVVSEILARQGALFVSFKHTEREFVVGVAAPEEYDDTGMVMGLQLLIDRLPVFAGDTHVNVSFVKLCADTTPHPTQPRGPHMTRQGNLAVLTSQLVDSFNNALEGLEVS